MAILLIQVRQAEIQAVQIAEVDVAEAEAISVIPSSTKKKN